MRNVGLYSLYKSAMISAKWRIGENAPPFSSIVFQIMFLENQHTRSPVVASFIGEQIPNCFSGNLYINKPKTRGSLISKPVPQITQ